MKLPLKIHHVEFILDFFVLPVKGVEMITGVWWLGHLGEVRINFRAFTLGFDWNDQLVQLQGETVVRDMPLGTKQLCKMELRGEIAELFQLRLENPTEPNHLLEIKEPRLRKLLSQYESVFLEPKGLCPVREINPHINLEPLTKPINVRPFRYPNFQKVEIEK